MQDELVILDRAYQSIEEQTHWYASMRAKEAVYGAGAWEAACERVLLQNALIVAGGRWRDLYARYPDRLEGLVSVFALLLYEPPADPEAAARLEGWLR